MLTAPERPGSYRNGEGGPEIEHEPGSRFCDQKQVLAASGDESVGGRILGDGIASPLPTNFGFVKLTRNPDVLELIKASPAAFVLATIIAIRARWKPGFNARSLEVGEAFLGDFKECGLTRQQYRTATRKLREARFATFKSTNSGTVGRLLDSRLYDLPQGSGNHQGNHQLTTCQPPGNQQATRNKKGKKSKKGKSGENYLARSPRERDFLSRWADAYESQFGQSYVDNGDTNTLLARQLLGALRDTSPESLVEEAKSAWAGDGYWGARAYSLHTFVNRINEIRAELSGCCPAASGL